MADESRNSNNFSNTCLDRESTFLNYICQHDVLLGRGGGSNNHIGNRRFRAIVSQHQDEYRQARKLDKNKVAQKIVDIVQQEGGRFLKRTESNSAWEQVCRKQALSKTSQALREGLDARNANAMEPSQSNNGTDTSTPSSTKTRKPYTIRQEIAIGEVKRKEERQAAVDSSLHTLPHQLGCMNSVEEDAAVAIASLNQNAAGIKEKKEDKMDSF